MPAMDQSCDAPEGGRQQSLTRFPRLKVRKAGRANSASKAEAEAGGRATRMGRSLHAHSHLSAAFPLLKADITPMILMSPGAGRESKESPIPILRRGSGGSQVRFLRTRCVSGIPHPSRALPPHKLGYLGVKLDPKSGGYGLLATAGVCRLITPLWAINTERSITAETT